MRFDAPSCLTEGNLANRTCMLIARGLVSFMKFNAVGCSTNIALAHFHLWDCSFGHRAGNIFLSKTYLINLFSVFSSSLFYFFLSFIYWWSNWTFCQNLASCFEDNIDLHMLEPNKQRVTGFSAKLHCCTLCSFASVKVSGVKSITNVWKDP